MSFKDALEKSAEAQKKLAEDKKLAKKSESAVKNTAKIAENAITEESKSQEPISSNIKLHTGPLAEILLEDELRDMSNRKTYQTYPTIHKMVKLACNKTGKDLITYINEAILEQLKKDDVIGLYELVHGKLK
jgi:undecaprenyl pyrophosphate synthase